MPSSVSLSKKPFGLWRHFTTYQNSFVFSLIFKFGNPGEALIAKALLCTRKQNPEDSGGSSQTNHPTNRLLFRKNAGFYLKTNWLLFIMLIFI